MHYDSYFPSKLCLDNKLIIGETWKANLLYVPALLQLTAVKECDTDKTWWDSKTNTVCLSPRIKVTLYTNERGRRQLTNFTQISWERARIINSLCVMYLIIKMFTLIIKWIHRELFIHASIALIVCFVCKFLITPETQWRYKLYRKLKIIYGIRLLCFCLYSIVVNMMVLFARFIKLECYEGSDALVFVCDAICFNKIA